MWGNTIRICRRSWQKTVFFLPQILLLYYICSGLFNKPVVCESPECVSLAAHVSSFVNESMDPCDGFYNFVCGKQLSVKQPNVFEQLERKRDASIRALVTDQFLGEASFPRSLKDQRQFYRLCLKSQIHPMKRKEDRLVVEDLRMLGVRMWGDQIVRDSDWFGPMLMAKRRGAFFGFFLTVDVQHTPNVPTPFIRVGPPSMHLMRLLQALKSDKHVTKMVRFLKAHFNMMLIQDVTSTSDELVRLVKFFLKVVPPLHAQKRKHVAPASIRSVQDLISGYSSVEMLDILQKITELPGLSDESVVVSYELKGGSYFGVLREMVHNVSASTWITYAAATIILHDCPYLSGWIRHECSEMLTHVDPEPEFLSLSKEEFCYKEARQYFPSVAESAYIRQQVSIEKRLHVRHIIKKLRNQLNASLEADPRLPRETKQDIGAYYQKMGFNIGWEHYVFEEAEAERAFVYWSDNIISHDVVDVRRKLNQAFVNSQFRTVLMSAEDWRRRKLAPNVALDVYLDFDRKLINVLTPLLDEPILTVDVPEYLHYATLGSIIGKVLMNVISNERILFQEVIASGESLSGLYIYEFIRDQQNCIASGAEEFAMRMHYGSPTFMKAFSDRLLSNILGPRLAYKAFEALIQKTGQGELLPGLDYTPRQLFWIMSSTYLCHLSEGNEHTIQHKYGIESFRYQDIPTQYLIEGPMLHFQSFAKDFNCKAGQFMNSFPHCTDLFVN